MTRRLADEAGVALVTVIGITFAVSLLVTATLSYALGTLPQTRDHEDWNAALAAAEAGVDDLLYRLNQDRTYWSRPDPGNPALSGWRPLPGHGSRAAYHYRFDASRVASTGAVDVVSTGRVGDSHRTVQVRLRPRNFLDAIYFTDFEASDPYAMTTNAAARTYLDGYCATYHPSRDTRDVDGTRGGCSTIRFAPGDVLVGPTISNDALLIRPGSVGGRRGPRFEGPVETGWDGRGADGVPTGQLWLRDGGATGEPVFQEGIRTVERLPLPETSASIAAQAADTGCRYEGPTYIALLGDRMVVVSPQTDPSSVGAGCLSPRSGSTYRPIDLKDGEVLYVADGTSAASGHPLGLPIAGDLTEYHRTDGDVFVHGRLDGQLTIAAQSDVVIVHDTTYVDQGPESNDLLGLIADDNVWVYHPVGQQGWSGSRDLPAVGRDVRPFDLVHSAASNLSWVPRRATTWDDPRIDAAILALNRSFSVQNFNRGQGFNCSGCDLSVRGAIAQRWRGPVATSALHASHVSTGYLKDYVYDQRLRYLTPPYFIEPERAPWERRRWAEVTPVPPTCTGSEAPPAVACLPA